MAAELKIQSQACIAKLESLLDTPSRFLSDLACRRQTQDVVDLLKTWNGSLSNLFQGQRYLPLLVTLFRSHVHPAVNDFVAFARSGQSVSVGTLQAAFQRVKTAVHSLYDFKMPAQTVLHTKPQEEALKRQRNVDFFKQRIMRDTLLVQRQATFIDRRDGQSKTKRVPGVKLGSLDFLWERLPRLRDLSQETVTLGGNPDGAVFSKVYIDETALILNAFCDAWLEVTDAVPNMQKFNLIRSMPRIVLIMSVVDGGRNGLDGFIEREQDDSSLPFVNLNDLVTIFRYTSSAVDMAKMFLAQQSRVIERHWRPGEKLLCSKDEPLRVWSQPSSSKVGGFGAVDKVVDLSDGQVYARKTIKATADTKPIWDKEIEILSQISSGSKDQHVVSFVKSFERGDNEIGSLLSPAGDLDLTSFLAEYCRQPLTNKSERTKTLLRSFGCLSLSLRFLHKEAGIQHRDIKPDNIVYHRFKSRPDMPENEEFLWIDFGHSHHSTPNNVSVIRNPNAIGTPAYAAPETTKKGQAPGRPSDIFSFGCTFLEIINAIAYDAVPLSNEHSILALRNYGEHIPQMRHWIEMVKLKLELSQPALARILGLASRMIDSEPADRPVIEEIVRELAQIGASCKTTLFCTRCTKQLKMLHLNAGWSWRNLKHILSKR